MVVGRNRPVHQSIAGDLGDPDALGQLRLGEREMARELDQLGVDGDRDPTRFDPELHRGPDLDAAGRQARSERRLELTGESAGPAEGQRLIRKSPPRLDEGLVVDRFDVGLGFEATDPVSGPSHAECATKRSTPTGWILGIRRITSAERPGVIGP